MVWEVVGRGHIVSTNTLDSQDGKALRVPCKILLPKNEIKPPFISSMKIISWLENLDLNVKSQWIPEGGWPPQQPFGCLLPSVSGGRVKRGDSQTTQNYPFAQYTTPTKFKPFEWMFHFDSLMSIHEVKTISTGLIKQVCGCCRGWGSNSHFTTPLSAR